MSYSKIQKNLDAYLQMHNNITGDLCEKDLPVKAKKNLCSAAESLYKHTEYLRSLLEIETDE